MNQRRTSWSPAPSSVCQIADRAQVGLRHPPIAVDLGLLDLELGKDLVRLVALGDEVGSVPTLIGGKLHGGIGAAALGCCLDGGVDLMDPTIEVGHHARLHGYAPLDIGSAAGDRDVTLDLMPDVRLVRKPNAPTTFSPIRTRTRTASAAHSRHEAIPRWCLSQATAR
jgi:hypothetical protein